MEAIAICSRALPPGVPITLAFKLKHRPGYQLAWPCPYCRGADHQHDERGLQAAPCGRGLYLVRHNGGKIHEL
jgi:hypothetical protein